MKRIVVFSCLTALVFGNVKAQSDPQHNFTKMRKSDFSKLIGGIQEGGKINYNNEKTNLEVSGGTEIKSAHVFIQGTGSVGTTTNLSTLFNQKALPAFSGNIALHYLIPGLSTWFYDGSFTSNFALLQNPAITTQSISTFTGSNQNSIFSYKDALQEKVAAGKITLSDRLYTYKRFFWLSLEDKYDNIKYSFYDAGRSFSDQLYEPVYNSWTGKVSVNGYMFWNKTDITWSRLKWRPNFVYFNIAARYGLGNNIQQLNKTTVNDIISTTVEGTATRQAVKSQSAYNGIYKEFKTFTPSFEFILSPFRSFAIDLFGDYNLINKTDRVKYNMDNFGSIATGLYFYGGEHTTINVGAYYKWTRDKATNSWAQQIGIKTTIPISPL